MRLFFIILLLIPVTFVFSQVSVEGTIKDQVTNQPIAYANIYAEGTLQGTLSGQDGSFQLSKLKKDGQLIISAIGYEDLMVRIPSNENVFFLVPTVYDLEEVLIPSGSPKVEELGFQTRKIQNKKITTLSHGLIWDGNNVSNTAAQAARHIENPLGQVGFIQSVSFYIHKQGRPIAPFRVRLIEMNPDNTPGRELITDNLIVQAQSGGIWLEVNVSDRQIEFPPNGFLVSMEWLQTKDESFWYETSYKNIMKNNPVYEEWKQKNHNRNTFWGYGQVVGLYNESSNNNQCWRSDIKTDWYSFQNKSGELMIKSKIKIWEN